MLPFMKTTEAPQGYAMVGKLPHRSDYVRANANHGAMREFDDLIHQALASLARLPDWEARYEHMPATDFYYTSRDGQWVLLGAMRPSRDMSGRRYPFIAAALYPVAQIAESAHLVPIAHEVFFTGLHAQIESAIENSVEAHACREFLASQVAAGAAGGPDLELAQGIVDRFLSSHTVGAWCTADGCRDRAPQLDQAILNMLFYGDFLRRFHNPSTLQAVLLPLPHAKGEAPLFASAWLSLLREAWRQAPWAGSFFVRHGGDASTLAVMFDVVPERFAASLVGGPIEAAITLDLTQEQEAWRAHRFYPETAYAIGRLLSDPALPLADLRGFLSDVGRKLAQA